ncbi:hypothetical protein R2B67_21275 [Streptomyces cyaneofuscatus]|uniref:hypothetical protein n=1 Tax=Streptomyces cyaneofuscatus TaxID=66883 RepID=UPI0029551195|nr:hypothetical protein [Streptomyces cyaneofuscatus]WOP10904.1 hypothetical protein R2B67_21275 [Streptomyces cyaneofuscatus]
MTMYAPTTPREVYLLCFDEGHRVGLVRRRSPQRVSLPTTRCAPGESYKAAIRRLGVGSGIRFGGLVARLDAASHGDGRRRKARLFTAYAEGQVRSMALWVPWRQAIGDVAHLDLPELEQFVEGYLAGWIPDGWITLTPDLGAWEARARSAAGRDAAARTPNPAATLL